MDELSKILKCGQPVPLHWISCDLLPAFETRIPSCPIVTAVAATSDSRRGGKMKIAPAAITLSFPLRIPYIYSELWVRDNGGLASLPFYLSTSQGRSAARPFASHSLPDFWRTKLASSVFFISDEKRLWEERGNSQETHYIHVEQIKRGFVGLERMEGRAGEFNLHYDWLSHRRRPSRPPRLNVEIKRAIARLNKQWAHSVLVYY